ncbi:MAG: hypothetical protein ACR2JP_05045 [Acidimicrobiia bacterium]
MKHLLRAAGTVGVMGLVVYLLRDRLLPPPVIDPAPARIHGAPTPTADPATTAPHPAASPFSAADDLTAIVGIGPVYAARLGAEGITSFAQLADAEPGSIAAAVSAREEMVADWIEQAGRLRSA